MCSTKIFLAVIFNEIKCHVNTFLGLVGDASLASPLCPQLRLSLITLCSSSPKMLGTPGLELE